MMDIKDIVLPLNIQFLIKRLLVLPLHVHGQKTYLYEINLLVQLKLC